MASTYSWHSRIDVVSPQWPKARSLLADELLSSWLIRNAFAHGCSPMTLTGSLWPGWRCWTVDVDRGITPERALQLAKATGVGVSDICAATLHPIASTINPALDSEKGIWPGILARG